jgi:poly(A) polymerase
VILVMLMGGIVRSLAPGKKHYGAANETLLPDEPASEGMGPPAQSQLPMSTPRRASSAGHPARPHAKSAAPMTEAPDKLDGAALAGDGARVDRVFDALEAAALAAEGHPSAHLVLPLSVDDFRAAARRDVKALRARLDRVVMGEDPERGLDELLEVGALTAIFPEVHAMVGFGDGEWRHKDVWKHTKQVVRQAVPRIEVRWAALFHDIGKVKTRSITGDGKVHFLGHAEVGTRMFDKLEKRMGLFGYEPSLKNTVRFLVLHHLRANQYSPDWTDSAVRRFARELGTHLEDLLCLARADITTKRPEKKRRGLQQIEELQQRISGLAQEDAEIPALPGGIGDEIMRAFALPPSRKIGELKNMLEDAVQRSEIAPHQPAQAYVEFIRTNRDRFGV